MEIHGRKKVLDMKMAEFRKLADYDGEKAKGYLVDQNNGGFTYLILKTADNKVVGIRVIGGFGSYGIDEDCELTSEYNNLQEFIKHMFITNYDSVRSVVWTIKIFRNENISIIKKVDVSNA